MKQIQIISTKELRYNLSEILEQVAIGGKEFIVKKFGKEKVKISPIKKEQKVLNKKKSIGKLPGFGMWKDREDMKDPSEWVRNLRVRESFRIHDKE